MKSMVCITLFLLCVFAVAGEQIHELKADPAYQEQLVKLDAAMKSKDESQVDGVLKSLASLVQGHPSQIVIQTVIFDRDHKHDSRSGWVAPLVFDRMRIAEQTIVSTLAPYIDSDDKNTAEVATSLVAGRDVDAYATYLHAHRGNPSVKIVAMMYNADADKALEMMMRIYDNSPSNVEERRSLLAWAQTTSNYLAKLRLRRASENDKEECLGAIKELASSRKWYARAYVIAINAKDPGIVDATIIDRLKGDQNDVVKALAQLPSLTFPSATKPR